MASENGGKSATMGRMGTRARDVLWYIDNHRGLTSPVLARVMAHPDAYEILTELGEMRLRHSPPTAVLIADLRMAAELFNAESEERYG